MAKRFAWPVRPAAENQNMVTGKCYRFTVLTPSLIRLEYSPEGIFEDRASQTVFYRDFPKTAFETRKENGMLTLQTQALTIRYLENAPFDEESLQITLRIEPASCWCFGQDFEDLGGTTKTLDSVEGSCPVERGIISRNGFSVLDDSDTLVLESDGWVGLRKENTKDVYFFGYGFGYLQALQDFYKLTGKPPMLPAYALGNWWSRYHPYTQQEYCKLVDKFQREDVPFSVAVVDMDWHTVDIPPEQVDLLPQTPKPWDIFPGWTGFSWNKELYPDYRAFLKYLQEHNLHVSLNLHPHDGIRRHEDMYPEMARACGIDPASGQRVAFDVLSRDFMEKYFDIVHHPYEEDGVDFWWMDWQQGTDYWWVHEPNRPGEYQNPLERMDPLWLINHLYILDGARDGKRPLFFSRYAGPGGHRYPVGFSGDTFVSWRSLQFQPQFTAMASNIGYCFWSHDIGGHMGGNRDDELTVRWVQLGVLSPVNRLHSSRAVYQSKEPWCYGDEAQAVLKDWLRLRHQLFPYLYTMNYRSHTQGIPLVLPMYYSHPKCQDAYTVPNQYWFGSELIAAPITRKTDPGSRLGKVTAWLPKGDWFDFFTGLRYASRRGRVMDLHRDLKTTPVLAKAGAIVPMARFQQQENRLFNSDQMDVVVFPGANNRFALYEDAGDYSDYKNGASATTEMALDWGTEATFTINPAQGDLSQIPASRCWRILLRGFHKEACVTANIPGAVITRDETSNTTVVTLTAAVTEKVTLKISGTELIHDNSDAYDRCVDIMLHSQLNYSEKEYVVNSIHNPGTVHQKLKDLFFHDQSIYESVDAVRELLSLTEDEYEGSQIG